MWRALCFHRRTIYQVLACVQTPPRCIQANQVSFFGSEPKKTHVPCLLNESDFGFKNLDLNCFKETHCWYKITVAHKAHHKCNPIGIVGLGEGGEGL